SMSPEAVAFDCDHLDAFTAIGIIGGTKARSFAHPAFAGEPVSVHLPATEAIPECRACLSLCTAIRPIRRNLEALTIGHTLKSSIHLSGALELGADAAQRVLEVLIERCGIQLRQLFSRGRCRLSALVTIGHEPMTPCKACTSCLITPSRGCRSTVMSAVCGSYFSVPRMHRAMVATSASRLQRAMAKLSGTSTRCRFVWANVCSLLLIADPTPRTIRRSIAAWAGCRAWTSSGTGGHICPASLTRAVTRHPFAVARHHRRPPIGLMSRY